MVSEIAYKDIMMRISYTQIDMAPGVVQSWWNNLSESSYHATRKAVWEECNTRLRADIFFPVF